MATIALLATACSGSDSLLVRKEDGAEPTDDTTPPSTAPWERDPPPDAAPTAATQSDDNPAPVAHVDEPPGRIRVDQFGYRPGDPKVAVIADPQVGYDASIEFEAGPRYEVRRVSDDVVVFGGTPQPWSGGEVHEQSGDRGWWFDFSAVTEPGTYYVIDVERDETTGPFAIDETVYDAVLDGALRMFWFNRANTPHPPELAGPWSDQADRPVAGSPGRRVAGSPGTSPTFGVHPGGSLYRSFMPDAQYHWGSNRVKANIGSANLTIAGVGGGEERALDHLHYFHGVNPLDMVYLSNMDFFGAERSAERLFHHWFGERTAYDVDQGSEFGVAPGFVVGGPNAAYSGSEAPPAGQPPMKSYRDWSPHGSDPAWEITEPAIYYQAACVRLLSEVMASA